MPVSLLWAVFNGRLTPSYYMYHGWRSGGWVLKSSQILSVQILSRFHAKKLVSPASNISPVIIRCRSVYLPVLLLPQPSRDGRPRLLRGSHRPEEWGEDGWPLGEERDSPAHELGLLAPFISTLSPYTDVFMVADRVLKTTLGDLIFCGLTRRKDLHKLFLSWINVKNVSRSWHQCRCPN